MSFVLHASERPGYLHFQVTGQNSVASVRSYLSEIYGICVVKKIGSVLIEEHLLGPSLSITEVFGVMSIGSAGTAPALQRIAYVDTNPAHDFAHMQFGENVAVTRGINIRVFASVADAEAWISKPQ